MARFLFRRAERPRDSRLTPRLTCREVVARLRSFIRRRRLRPRAADSATVHGRLRDRTGRQASRTPGPDLPSTPAPVGGGVSASPVMRSRTRRGVAGANPGAEARAPICKTRARRVDGSGLARRTRAIAAAPTQAARLGTTRRLIMRRANRAPASRPITLPASRTTALPGRRAAVILPEAGMPAEAATRIGEDPVSQASINFFPWARSSFSGGRAVFLQRGSGNSPFFA